MSLNPTQSTKHLRNPRICMPSFSGFTAKAFRAGLYEAQDVLLDCDDVDLIQLRPAKGFALKSQWLTRLVFHDVSRRAVFLNPGLQPVRLTKEYDAFIFVCSWWQDVLYANAIQGWQDYCRTSVCWIDEFWSHNVQELQYWLPILSRFDHVIVGIGGSGKTLGDAIGRTCHEMHGGVDAIRFTPYPDCPERVIDVCSVGRRREEIHHQLLKLTTSNRLFYVYDTLKNVGNRETMDYRQHRDLYANIAKRSRCFMVAPGKVNRPDETNGQAAIAFRYFEGSAAGAALVGQIPDCESFRQHFDWPEAVIQTEPDGSDAKEVILRLLVDPGRLREISSRNAEEALRRHDWVYRWKKILALAGLDPMSEMRAREKRLGELAEVAKFAREKNC